MPMCGAGNAPGRRVTEKVNRGERNSETMVSIEIDGEVYLVEEGNNLLQTCLSLGLDLPYFCWHPAMGSVGACRQCALVQYHDRHKESGDERDEIGRIVMGCMTPVADGMRLSLNTESARLFRSEIVELLMTNHPHDCPVCEEGGECHLQDMTVMTGHTARQYRGLKRTHRNQYLGPFISHEMNRCIACYRCVRFYQDYAGGSDLQALASRSNVYFGRHEDGVLENEFSGNLVEVCPTGVFTDKPLSERYSRKWDLQAAPSICVHCAQGCNISPGERYGELRRVVNRYNGEVNGYFLCDRGRFGYGFVNRDDRVRRAIRNSADSEGEPLQDILSRPETRDRLANEVGAGKELLGIGSPRASLEANFALRELVGAENFYSGASDQEDRLVRLALQIAESASIRVPTLKEVEAADAVLVLGEDVINTSPRLALSLRQAVRNAALELADELDIPRWQDAAVREAAQADQSPLFNLTLAATRIDDAATRTLRAAPDELARIGVAIARALDDNAPEVADLPEEQQRLANEIAGTLARSNGAQVSTDLYLCVPEANSLGLAMLTRERPGHTLGTALQRVAEEDADTLIVLENNLARRVSREQLRQQLQGGVEILLLDHLWHETSEHVDLVLPAAPFSECEGTLVSSEGRAQRYYPVQLAGDDVRGSWEWLSDMIALHNGASEPRWQQLDDLTRDCAAAVPALAGIVDAAPGGAFRIEGMKIARQPHRYSGRTAMLADVNVSEPRQPQDTDSPLGYTMEGFPGEKPASLTPYYWAPGWNSNQAVGKFQAEISGPLRSGDPGVRLLADGEATAPYYDVDMQPVAGEGWLLLPRHHIFGSDELSNLAAPIAERSAEPALALNPADAQQLGIGQGQGVQFTSGGTRVSLMATLDPSCPPGTLGVSAGTERTAGIEYLQRVSLSSDPAWVASKPQLIATDQPARPAGDAPSAPGASS